ncbi:MAG: glycerol-3-phosphate acyltransferase [Caldiserica bacterium]|nr:glycerol-3-phosphate acyltransferase [Caldisericota bacterium]
MTPWELPAAILAVVLAYALGSIPSAVIAGRRAGVDIREVGDGNMGARNVARTVGAVPAVIVALCDVFKGAAAVLLARALSLSQGWVLAAAWAAVLGHDFPVFAHFRGGQGLATTLGTLLVLMPLEMSVALSLFGALYLLTHNSDLGASIGLACGLYLAYRGGLSPVLLFHMVASLLAIPTKKLLDRHRRLAIQHHQSGLV